LQKYKSSGALKQNGQPSTVDLRSNDHGRMRASWTAPCARRTGPRWTPHLNEGVRDLGRPRKICWPWTCARDGRRRRRRRQGRRGGASPGNHRRTLSCCSGRHLARVWALSVAGERASKPRGSGGWRGHPRRPAPEGGGIRPRRRTRGAA
jgi:hypothetical protein